jgi:hypothetical protein
MRSHRPSRTLFPNSCKSERISALSNTSSRNSENKPSTSLAAWMARLLDTMGQRLFASADARARQRGWKVTYGNGGLSRRYRDPRFDTLAGCPSCGGTGDVDEVPCPPCSGTGRTIVRRALLVPGGAGDA